MAGATHSAKPITIDLRKYKVSEEGTALVECLIARVFVILCLAEVSSPFESS